MEDETSRLERKQRDLLENVSYENFTSWLANPVTKAAFLQLEIDKAQIKENWANRLYSTEEEPRQQGAALYIDLALDALRGLKRSKSDA